MLIMFVFQYNYGYNGCFRSMSSLYLWLPCATLTSVIIIMCHVDIKARNNTEPQTHELNFQYFCVVTQAYILACA